MAAPGSLVAAVLRWYGAHARDLPWRRPGTTPWAVLVSEVMLQQTPVERVREPWARWLERWPTPADLAREPASEAIRAWGRLGYPRRALRLHAAATAITTEHAGQVPSDHDALLALPGVGDYTAAAVASFGFGQRHVVLDTNVRRVLARAVLGDEFPGRSPAAERRAAEALLPAERRRAARWAVAVMELGALVCTARDIRCAECPLRRRCAWVAAGRPRWDGPPRRGQTYEGTDRQCRGALLAVLRESFGPVRPDRLLAAWPDRVQADRALAGLVTDGLAEQTDGGYRLPA